MTLIPSHPSCPIFLSILLKKEGKKAKQMTLSHRVQKKEHQKFTEKQNAEEIKLHFQ